jgi:hypothetical protein
MIAMLNEKGANMKRLIALLAIVALCITMFSPPVAALSRDPTTPLPWMGNNNNPEGDEGGWVQPSTAIESDNQTSLFIEFVPYFSIFLGHKVVIPIFIKIDSKGDDSKDIERNIPGRRASSE